MKYRLFIKGAKILAVASLFALTTACGGGGSDAAAVTESTDCTWDTSNWGSCNWK